VRHQVEREVERGNRANDADRHPRREGQLALACGRGFHRHHLAGEAPRLDCGHRVGRDRALGLDTRRFQRLARLGRDRARDLVAALCEQLGDAVEDRRAAVGRERAFHGADGGVDGAPRVLRARARDAADHVARVRGADLVPFAGLDPFAVEQQPAFGDRESHGGYSTTSRAVRAAAFHSCRGQPRPHLGFAPVAGSEVTIAGVVGLGTMGAGIAQVCVQAGVRTIGRELTPELAQRGRETVAWGLGRHVEKERMTPEERDAALARLTVTSDLGDLADCDLVIEAAVEELAVKQELFGELDGLVRPEAVLATNTSALSVTEIASATEHRGRVVGMHFFNPAAVLPLVEVVRTDLSSEEAVATAYAFAERIGKQPIACRDTPGFVVNRILIPVLNDAVRVLDEGTASAEDIDNGMRLGTSWPLGPLALIDLVGVDVHVHATEALWRAFREPRFAPPPRLLRMLQAGQLGRKTGRGFYEY
jgi:3-hydroxybutyryl-CoA dehydrogenase